MLNSSLPIAGIGFRAMFKNLGKDAMNIGGWALELLGVIILIYGFWQVGRGTLASQNKGHYFMGGVLAIVVGAALATGGHAMVVDIKNTNDSASKLLHGHVNAIMTQPLTVIKSLPSMSWFNF